MAGSRAPNDREVVEVAAGLTEAQRDVLCNMADDTARSADDVAERAEVSSGMVRKCWRELRALGLADFGPIFSEEGQARGRGYWLNAFGWSVRAHLQSQASLAATGEGRG